MKTIVKVLVVVLSMLLVSGCSNKTTKERYDAVEFEYNVGRIDIVKFILIFFFPRIFHLRFIMYCTPYSLCILTQFTPADV